MRELMNGLKVILRNGFIHKTLFAGTLIYAGIYAIISPIDTYLMGRFIDYLRSTSLVTIPFTGQSVPIYTLLLALWFIAIITELVLNRARVMASLKLNELSRTTYITTFMRHLFRLPISFHKTVKMGEIQEKMTTAASGLGGILGDDISNIVPQFLSTFIFLGILFFMNHTAFIVALVAIVIYTYATIVTVRPTVPLQRQSNAAYAKVRGMAMDSIINIKIVKDFGAEGHQTEAVRAGYQDIAMPIWYKMIGFRRTQSLVQNVVVTCARGSILILSIYLVRDNIWTIGDLVIANSYLNQLFNPIAQLSNNWRNIQNGVIALEETERVLALPEEVYEPANALKEVRGKISFKDVSFGYTADRPVLEHISFEVDPGQIVALVGESGVGKSTLTELISGYFFPTSGSMNIDDIPVRQVSLSALRDAIGTVTQEITLFNDTIKNNLRFGNFNVTDEQIYAAAKKAHCDFIERFPEKWEQMVGERGLKLSVGQKQRIAIARAILKNPRILILDEPTSALDAGSERIITESLDKLMEGKTTFIVAHRLSTVRRADKILVFKGGTIVESGNHDELLKIPEGEYRRLYELQIGLHA